VIQSQLQKANFHLSSRKHFVVVLAMKFPPLKNTKKTENKNERLSCMLPVHIACLANTKKRKTSWPFFFFSGSKMFFSRRDFVFTLTHSLHLEIISTFREEDIESNV
jgi:hypothetical protein